MNRLRKLAPARAVMACLFICAMAGRAASADEAAAPPSPVEQVTFLYYSNLDEAAQFYETVLGLERTRDEEWVKFFAITSTSSVGLVDESKGYHRASDDKPVMLSLVTDDVDGWYRHLTQKNVRFLKHLDDSGSPGFIRAFLIQDPGGYSVEVFEWK